MRYEWLIALRYLRAKRKQTFISVISFISVAGVTLGVAALILVLAIMTGFHDGVRQQILGNIPHVLVQAQDDRARDWPELAERLRQADPRVRAVAPFVSQQVMLLAGDHVTAVNLKGIDADSRVLQQDYQTLDGRSLAELLLQPAGRYPGLVLAADTAATLGVGLGQRVDVIPPDFSLTPFGVIPKIRPFEVVAIARQRGGFLDTYYAYLGLEAASSLIGRTAGQLSGLEIELAGFDQAPAVAAQLQQQLDAGLTVRSWQDLFGSFLAALKLEKLGLFIVLAIIVLVAAFNIGTTLIMVVMEKNKDIAILRSMGASAGSILAIFLFKGLLIGLCGTGLGTALGLTLALKADAIIRGLERSLGVTLFDSAVYGMERFPSQVVPADVLTVMATAMAICLLATLYPALRAARLDPAEALRYE
ncbi:lipoprotein-releasing ABC transporter permease subunit [Desulfuromonas thiophila]|uniref:lipoprotein-releasing ABC transporter permease subunit n=1 Tax=Desulfuromonas thiophila TaxID=57664 RepID=UPI0029F4D19D|nr:lipoprotein-releasing ABC transporter permease subunit [Desulfuromonas thiophila]